MKTEVVTLADMYRNLSSCKRENFQGIIKMNTCINMKINTIMYMIISGIGSSDV